MTVIFCCALYFYAKFENQKENFSQISARNTEKTETKQIVTTSAVGQMGKVSQLISPLPKGNATSAAGRLFVVERVVDGDTIVVAMNGDDETVRLLGMDTPETVDPRKPVQCFGPEASAETKSLLDGREVTLQSDPTQSDRDKYGRLLRYVFRDDGLFVDEFLVQQGFAREYTYFGVDYKYQIAFRADQSAARVAGLGLWATSTCDGKI